MRIDRTDFGTITTSLSDRPERWSNAGRNCRNGFTGQYGNVTLSPEAELFLRRRGCKVIAEPTPRAIEIFNEKTGEKLGLFHVTC